MTFYSLKICLHSAMWDWRIIVVIGPGATDRGLGTTFTEAKTDFVKHILNSNILENVSLCSRISI